MDLFYDTFCFVYENFEYTFLNFPSGTIVRLTTYQYIIH